MEHFDQKNMRRRVARTLLVSTLVFFLLLGGALWLRREIPQRRLTRIEALLDAGDYAAARPLIGRVDDEAMAESFRARCDYLEGVERMEKGEWAEARELLANAGSLADAAERVQACSYALAEALLADGAYDAAAEAFSALGGYLDAADRALGCRYEKALTLEAGGDAAGAAEIYELLGAYRDSAERLRRLAVEVTGISDSEEALEQYINLGDWRRRKGSKNTKYHVDYREYLKDGMLHLEMKHPMTAWETWIRTLGIIRSAQDLPAAEASDTYRPLRTQVTTRYLLARGGKEYVFEVKKDGELLDVSLPEDYDENFTALFKKVFQKALTCFGCRTCEVNCPHGHMHFEDGQPVIDDGCLHCGACHTDIHSCFAFDSWYNTDHVL